VVQEMFVLSVQAILQSQSMVLQEIYLGKSFGSASDEEKGV